MKISKGRHLILPLAILVLSLPFLAMKCTGAKSWQTPNGPVLGGGWECSTTPSAIDLATTSEVVTPPSWLELKNVAPVASIMLQGKDMSGNPLTQSLALPFSLQPGGATTELTCNFMSAPDQQTAYDAYIAQADPSQPTDVTTSITFDDVRILAISPAIYQPYDADVRLYNGNLETYHFTYTSSLDSFWKGCLLSAISQVPGTAWTPKLLGKPGYLIWDYQYYENKLIAKVTTAMGNFANQDPSQCNSNLLAAMSHLDGTAPTQYITDPAARDALHGIFLKVQTHVQNVANGVAEAP